MSKKAPLKNAPTGDALTADEQKFFDTGGEEGGTTAPDHPVENQQTAAPEPETTGSENEENSAQAETGAQESGQQQPAAQKQPQKMVPHQALHEARLREKEAKDLLALQQQQYKTLEERTNLLLQNLTKQPAEAANGNIQPQTAPDPENDPLGYLLWGVKNLAERQDKFEQSQKQQTEQGQQISALARLQNDAMAREAEFRSETPDYDAASQHLQKARMAELTAIGYSGAEAREMLKQEAISIATRTLQQGKNPAEAIYEMAKLRGYKPASAVTETTTQTPEQTAVEQATTKLANVQNGQRQTATLSQARGSAPSPMTAQRLMEMSPSEFEAFRAKSPTEFRNLMGA